MITVSFNGSDLAALAVLQRVGPAFTAGLKTGIEEASIRLQSHIQREKLSGQVLHHRSGKLINSIRALSVTVQGSSVVGGVEGAGGPAYYGKFHEFGTRPYVRQTKRGQSSGHGLPERSFMRSSFMELQPQIEQIIVGAVALNVDEVTGG